VLILLSSHPESYDHIVAIILYGKETLILEEVMLTFLSNEIRKRLNQVDQERSDLVAIGRKRKEGKKSPSS